jgi:xanthine dehydrogenase YagS FAD-binding subunit
MSIAFPRSLDEASMLARPAAAEVRAGGTDWQERRELGLTGSAIVDLRDVPGLDDVTPVASGLRVGARVTLAALSAHPQVAAGYPALVLAASALATPQIRTVATLGGSLLQRNRCSYYRNPQFRCFKSGAASCPARSGDHHFLACFDLGPCIAPHPSTVGMALTTYDAEVEIHGSASLRPIAALFGDGTDPARDHQLQRGEILTAIRLPAPIPGERGGYFRAIGRAWAEWPLVEVSVRLLLDGGRIELARVAIGGVANIPLRLPAVERALEGSRGSEAFERAGALAIEGANPLPMTGYKLRMIPGAVVTTLERALGTEA